MRYVNDCFTAVDQVERALFDFGTINFKPYSHESLWSVYLRRTGCRYI